VLTHESRQLPSWLIFDVDIAKNMDAERQASGRMPGAQVVREARRRRAHLLIWWFAWVPLGIAVTWLSFAVFGPPGLYAGYLALIGWGIVAHRLMRRLTDLYCPQCGEVVVKHPFFIAGRLECSHCGWCHEKRANQSSEPTR
jgi:hypothetical protein